MSDQLLLVEDQGWETCGPQGFSMRPAYGWQEAKLVLVFRDKNS